ncbi:RcpC/CpaB family pilus assembly protein [Cellulomonas fimi]|uniref:SAF domain-containing protein n=1 Tax=Cellulomonas fimi TaxID=1708 RepID=UPI00234E3682|nr:SAF domain-containing protein [Cellulomonas fimi]MDC7123109.1 RcpC/CpaB family pilus assembly protein [Cellulomonas fimi]
MPPQRPDRPHPDRPPPLARHRGPAALRVRVVLWRARPALLALALAAAALGTVGALRPAPPPTVDLVVAARPVRAGAPFAADDVAVRAVPVAVAPDDVAVDPDLVVGRVAAVDLVTGTPLVPGVLVPPDATGPPGTVVTAVRLADEAAGAMLRPGMRVDVLAAAPDEGDGRVVASRALVLPVPPAAQAQADATSFGADTAAAPPVLVAVTPDEARALAGASATALLSAVVVP